MTDHVNVIVHRRTEFSLGRILIHPKETRELSSKFCLQQTLTKNFNVGQLVLSSSSTDGLEVLEIHLGWKKVELPVGNKVMVSDFHYKNPCLSWLRGMLYAGQTASVWIRNVGIQPVKVAGMLWSVQENALERKP